MSETTTSNNNQTLKLRYTLSSECSCETYDDDTDTSYPSSECFGCYDDELMNITHDLLNSWLDANDYNLDTPIKVVGSKMTWRGVGGYAITTPKDLVSSLTLNADFTLYFYSDETNQTLKVIRSSHDELGAGFEFELSTQDELDEYRSRY